MKLRLTLLFGFGLFYGSVLALAEKADVRRETIRSGGRERTYWLFIPEGGAPDAKRVSLALAALALRARSAPAAVFIVRHAEKQSDANEKEVPLSEAGRARSKRLAGMLRDARIVAIYSTDTVRTLSTAEPLASAAKLTPQIYEASGPESAATLAARISREHPAENVLVVGHSNTVGPLITALGCTEEVKIGPQEYDGVWIVIPSPPAAGATPPASGGGNAPSPGGSPAPAAARRPDATLLRLRN